MQRKLEARWLEPPKEGISLCTFRVQVKERFLKERLKAYHGSKILSQFLVLLDSKEKSDEEDCEALDAGDEALARIMEIDTSNDHKEAHQDQF